MLLHYLLAVINYIDMNQVLYEKQYNMHAYANLTIKKLFVLIITLSKEEKKRNFKQTKKEKKNRLLVFTRKVNVRAHPSVHSFLFQGSKNMIQHDWTTMVRHQQSAYLRQVSTCFFFLSFLSSVFGTSSIISQD